MGKPNTWTPKEDQFLMDCISEHGLQRGLDMGEFRLKNKNLDSCKNRYYRHLREKMTHIKKVGPWTEEITNKLISLLGDSPTTKEFESAAEVLGKTTNACRLKFRRLGGTFKSRPTLEKDPVVVTRETVVKTLGTITIYQNGEPCKANIIVKREGLIVAHYNDVVVTFES